MLLLTAFTIFILDYEEMGTSLTERDSPVLIPGERLRSMNNSVLYAVLFVIFST